MNSFKNLKGDLLGGVVSGIIGLPLCLAFGATSGIGAINGLYGGIVLGILAAIFGGTKTQISAPTAPMTVVTALLVAQEVAYYGTLEKALPSIFATVIISGAILVLFGILKIGSYISYLPYSVISGFMTGIGIMVIAVQFKFFFGSEQKYNSALENLLHFPDHLKEIDLSTFFVATLTLISIILSNRFLKTIPPTLFGLIVGISTTYLLGLNIEIIGNIPSGIPKIQTSTLNIDLDRIPILLGSATTLAGLGMIDSLLTSVIVDKMTKTKHDSNKELIGQGIGNMGAGLFGGIPGAGTTVVSLANSKSGTTRLSGVFQGLFLLLVLLFLGPYANNIPYAVLSGILIYIGIDIIDYSSFRNWSIIPKADRFIIIVVFVVTIVWSLLYATLIGFILASIFFMKKMADTIDSSSRDSGMGRVTDKMIDMLDDIAQFQKDIYIKIIVGPIFFGFANRLEEELKNHEDIKALVLNFKYMPYMDQTGLYSLRDAIIDLHYKKIKIYLVGLNNNSLKMLHGVGVIPEFINISQVFTSTKKCIIDIYNHYNQIEYRNKYGLEIPCAFTPSSENDHWSIEGVEKYPNATLRIYDPSNKIFYESKKITWDGTHNEKLLPTGKYQFELQLSEREVLNGPLLLVR